MKHVIVSANLRIMLKITMTQLTCIAMAGTSNFFWEPPSKFPRSTPASYRLDKMLLGVYLLILAFGLIMVASASSPVGKDAHHFVLYFFCKQAAFAILSLLTVIFMLFVSSARMDRLGKLWLLLGLIFLVLVLVPGIGHTVNGSRRWIRFGPLALQVSELVKLFAVFYIAHYLAKHPDAVRETVMGVFKPLLLLGLFGILLLLEPDFGATVVIFVTAMGMMFMAGVRIRWFILLVALAAAAVVALVLLSPYRLARLTGFLHPWENQLGSGYQLTQALIAFGRGGWFGVGLGESLQKLYFLPEAHTDFILAIIGEELGLVGVGVLLALYGVIVWRGLSVALTAQKQAALFDSYLAYGITFWLAFQVIVNVGVNIGLLPTKGLTLPFVSYGGSSLLVDSITIGILLRIDLQNQQRA